MTSLQVVYQNIAEQIANIPMEEFVLPGPEAKSRRQKQIDGILQSHTQHLEPSQSQRIYNEIFSFGPLEEILEDPSITEIIINSEDAIWVEKQGRLENCKDSFYSLKSYQDIVERLTQLGNIHVTQESPRAEGRWGPFRMTLIGPSISEGKFLLNLRRHPQTSWTLEKLQEVGWCSEEQRQGLQDLIRNRKNFVVIGSTGAGKTSVVSSLLQEVSEKERTIIIEDTSELRPPNSASIKLLTRQDPHHVLPDITQSDLLKSTLRLRPDRIVMGEVRGSEAKDFLMALATGHEGSFGTLHAQSPSQALIRLEMLIQMGAPQWSLTAIRRLLQMSLEYIVVTGKSDSGKREFQGVFKICSLEDNGFLIERCI